MKRTVSRRLISIICMTLLLIINITGAQQTEHMEVNNSGFTANRQGISVFPFISSSLQGRAVGPGATLFGGGKITMLTNSSDSQMMSFVIETGKGGLIVVDGGTAEDEPHLEETIMAKGGHVNAWLITHPHSDHVGALDVLLRKPDRQIVIDDIYYSFTSIEWYNTYEAYRADMVAKIAESLNTLPAESLHGNVYRGQEIWVDDVKITVLNSPYLIENNAINNSSVAFNILMNGVSTTFLGDMGAEAGHRLIADYNNTGLKCDILQMSHHGQYGVDEETYRIFSPSICLWPTPGWLWDNDNGGGVNSGPWYTLITRQWTENMGVRVNYCIKDGDQIIE